MPRLKTYYTESEITKNLYTTGKQWMFENFKEYIGSFHIYTTGEVYSEAEYNTTLSKRLINPKVIRFTWMQQSAQSHSPLVLSLNMSQE